MKNLFYLSALIMSVFMFTSCEKDDAIADHDHEHTHDNTHDHDNTHGHELGCIDETALNYDPNASIDDGSCVLVPETYDFNRNGLPSVSYGGQTCRLQMAKDIYNVMDTENGASVPEFLNMFDGGMGFDYMYTCGKNIGSKTAASSSASSTVKSEFDDMFTVLVEQVYPNWNTFASQGVAGQITTSSGSTYQVDGKGLEIDQAFIKGLMGAMVVDQMTNNYLTPIKLDGDGTTNNVALIEAGENFTDMEHYWDEAFGYLYGYNNEHVGGSDNNANGPAEGNGVLVNKYLKKLNDTSHPGIANTIYDAFILGRAAIVAQDYDLRDEQASIIKVNVDKIIAQKAIDYLSGGAATIASGAPREDAFHGLSEGYGFVLSLQFTDMFTNSEVNSMLDQMMEGDGFWDITVDELESMASTIESSLLQSGTEYNILVNNILVQEMSFYPNNITIEVGDQVQFIHEGIGTHDVNFTTSSITLLPFNNPSEIISLPAQSDPGSMGIITFNVPGTYNYDCSMYGHASMGMVGSITVNEVSCENDDSTIESLFGDFFLNDCESLISFLETNYDYSLLQSCSWNGSPMVDLGYCDGTNILISDICECSCDDLPDLSISQIATQNKKVLYKVDILGNIIKNQEIFNSPYFIIYRDGSVKKFVQIK